MLPPCPAPNWQATRRRWRRTGGCSCSSPRRFRQAPRASADGHWRQPLGAARGPIGAVTILGNRGSGTESRAECADLARVPGSPVEPRMGLGRNQRRRARRSTSQAPVPRARRLELERGYSAILRRSRMRRCAAERAHVDTNLGWRRCPALGPPEIWSASPSPMHRTRGLGRPAMGVGAVCAPPGGSNTTKFELVEVPNRRRDHAGERRDSVSLSPR